MAREGVRDGGGRMEVGGRIVGLLTASPGLVGADMTEVKIYRTESLTV